MVIQCGGPGPPERWPHDRIDDMREHGVVGRRRGAAIHTMPRAIFRACPEPGIGPDPCMNDLHGSSEVVQVESRRAQADGIYPDDLNVRNNSQE